MEEEYRLTQKPDFERLLLICESTGYWNVPEMIDRYLFKEKCPAICLNCGHVEEKAPDTLAGWCAICDKDSMRSAFVLAGIY